LPQSARSSVSSRYCAGPCGGAVAETAAISQQQAASDDYMQPIDEGTSTPKYDCVIVGKYTVSY